jgi:hypothetical protein
MSISCSCSISTTSSLLIYNPQIRSETTSKPTIPPPYKATMTCLILTKWRQLPPGTHSHNYCALIAYGDSSLLNLAFDTDFITQNGEWSELGERLYFLVGGALAAQKEWNRMTFLQLEHEARVQGLLGPFEEHNFSAVKLRIKLACEAAAVENEARDMAKEQYEADLLAAKAALEKFVGY